MAKSICLGLCLILIGCHQAPPATHSLPAGSLSMSWQPPDQSNAVPGIDEGCVQIMEGIVGVWGDSPGGSGGNTRSGTNGFQGEGYLQTREGKKVEFHVETKDGKTGTVVLDGKNYDLTQGNLFLVSFDGQQWRVKQLQVDLSRLTKDPESFKAMAKANPAIAEFFGRKKAGEGKKEKS